MDSMMRKHFFSYAVSILSKYVIILKRRKVFIEYFWKIHRAQAKLITLDISQKINQTSNENPNKNKPHIIILGNPPKNVKLKSIWKTTDIMTSKKNRHFLSN